MHRPFDAIKPLVVGVFGFGFQEQDSPPAIPYRHRVWQLLILGQRLIEDLKVQHQQVHEEADRGIPFPTLTPTSIFLQKQKKGPAGKRPEPEALVGK